MSTVELQRMPTIWDDTSFTTSRTAILGALADWAVRQSPYLVPENLEGALREFDATLPATQSATGHVPDEYFESSCERLYRLVEGAIARCPVIVAWNTPKEGEHAMVFVTGYGRPKPDCDFIDLDALARNVAHSVTLREKYDKVHD